MSSMLSWLSMIIDAMSVMAVGSRWGEVALGICAEVLSFFMWIPDRAKILCRSSVLWQVWNNTYIFHRCFILCCIQYSLVTSTGLTSRLEFTYAQSIYCKLQDLWTMMLFVSVSDLHWSSPYYSDCFPTHLLTRRHLACFMFPTFVPLRWSGDVCAIEVIWTVSCTGA